MFSNGADGLARRAPCYTRRVVRHEGRAIAFVVLGLSLVCHTAVACSVLLVSPDLGFSLELIVLLGVSCLLSAIGFVSTRMTVFAFVHALRFIAATAALGILGGRAELLEMAIVLPFVAETTISLRTVPAAVIGAAFALTLAAMDLANIGGAAVGDALSHAGFVVLLTGVAVSLGCAFTRYREKLVANDATIAGLDLAVSNLATANRAFQSYAVSVESASVENERNRITRELHDVVGYALTNLIMMIRACKVLARKDSEKLADLLDQARVQADVALQESRTILYRLRSIREKQSEGLSAIHHLVRSFRAATGVEVSVHYGNLPQSSGELIDRAIVRLVQEGLTNAIRHGRATKVRILLWRSDADIQVRIWDNGKGAKEIKEGIGLSGMRERFKALGGTICASGAVDGFILDATIPVAELENVGG